MALFAELRRRNVFKVALLYAIASWLSVWFVGNLQPRLDLPAWTESFALVLLAIGFPAALWFAWTYEITPVGLKKAVDVDQTQSIVYKTGQKLNAAVAVLLVLGVLAVFGQRLLPTFEFPVIGTPEGDSPARAATPAEIRRLILGNGLEIIVWPDHDIPNVVMYHFVRAGGRNEYPGITGVAHFFEHMMFLGTKTLAAGEFDRIVEAAGGASNAYTSADLSVYQNWFPRSALATVFELEGDRFANLNFVPEVVESEREVVYAERRSSIDNNNVWKLGEQVEATAFLAHPYQYPEIGWPSDIENWTREDLVAFYRTYYAPNNRTLVITGDVTPGEVFALAEDRLAGAAAQKAPPPVRTVEPEQLGVRRIVIEAPVQAPVLHMVFHGSTAADPDTLAMDLLLNVLASGDSSRLHQALVEQTGLALSIGGYQHEGFDPGLVWIYMTLPPGGDPSAAEGRVLEELARIADEGVTAAELDKARNIRLAEFWRSLATIDGKAAALGEYAVLHGDYENLFTLPDTLAAIAPDDLQAVAARVFRDDNMTVGMLRDPGEDEAQ